MVNFISWQDYWLAITSSSDIHLVDLGYMAIHDVIIGGISWSTDFMCVPTSGFKGPILMLDAGRNHTIFNRRTSPTYFNAMAISKTRG